MGKPGTLSRSFSPPPSRPFQSAGCSWFRFGRCPPLELADLAPLIAGVKVSETVRLRCSCRDRSRCKRDGEQDIWHGVYEYTNYRGNSDDQRRCLLLVIREQFWIYDHVCYLWRTDLQLHGDRKSELTLLRFFLGSPQSLLLDAHGLPLSLRPLVGLALRCRGGG
jgi:hypothetical protein